MEPDFGDHAELVQKAREAGWTKIGYWDLDGRGDMDGEVWLSGRAPGSPYFEYLTEANIAHFARE